MVEEFNEMSHKFSKTENMFSSFHIIFSKVIKC